MSIGFQSRRVQSAALLAVIAHGTLVTLAAFGLA